MALTLSDMIGWEHCNARATHVRVEGHSNGTAASVISRLSANPAPWPETEFCVLKLDQDKTDGWWRGNAYSAAQGQVWSVSFYIYFERFGGLPPTNDMPIFRLRTTGGANHVRLNITANGPDTDLEIIDANSAVVGTISDAFPLTEQWYRVDILVKLQNKDTPSGGVGGDLKMRVVRALPGASYGSADISNEDFYGGDPTIGPFLQGETGNIPAVHATTWFGSVILFHGGRDPLNTGDYVGNYTIFGVQPIVNITATPEFDKTGALGGDVLDIGTWDKLGDGLAVGRCVYSQANDNGIIRVGFPDGDARILGPDAIRYGTSWFGFTAGRPGVTDVRVWFGNEDSGGTTATLQSVDVPKTHFKRVRPSPTLEADFDKDQVIGFEALANADHYFSEAWVMTAFDWPVGTAPSGGGGKLVNRDAPANTLVGGRLVA